MTETFRLKKSLQYQGIAFSAMFLAITVGCLSIFFLENPAKHGFKGEHSVAIVGGMCLAVFGTMLLLSLCVLVAYHLERFTIRGTTLSIRTIFHEREFDVSELQSLEWRAHGAGALLFRVLGSTARLELGGFATRDQLRIIRVLSTVAPADVQKGWSVFCHKIALPLRDGKPSIARTEPAAQLFTIDRRRYDRMLAPGVVLSIALAVALWAWLNLWLAFVLPFLTVAGLLYLRFSVPRGGRDEASVTSTPYGRLHLIYAGILVGGNSIMLGSVLLDVWGEIAGWILGVFVIAACPFFFRSAYKIEKQRRANDEEGALLAPAKWRDGERLVEARRGVVAANKVETRER